MAMPLSSISIPVSVEVSVSEVIEGIFEIEGVLTYADETLSLDYQTSGLGSQKATIETSQWPLSEVREVVLKGWMLGAKIVLYPRRLATLAQMPWSSGEEIVLRVKRRHRSEAAALVAHLQQVLSERTGDALSSIPFQLPDANYGLTEIKGLVYLDEEFLVFEVGTGWSGGFRKERQTIKIELRALKEMRLDRGVLSDRLCVRPKKRDLFQVMPGSYKGKEELQLKTRKRDREHAAQLVYEMRRLRRTLGPTDSGHGRDT